MTHLTVRAPVPADIAAITAIDATGLATGHASFREEPHDGASFRAAFQCGRALARVAEDQHGIAAWAGISPTSARAVYAGVGEISVYVDPDRRGTGIGRHLLAEVIKASEQSGYWTLVAQIFPENAASLALHKRVGFHTLGTRRKLGLMGYGPMAGRWRDVTLLERRSGIAGRA